MLGAPWCSRVDAPDEGLLVGVAGPGRYDSAMQPRVGLILTSVLAVGALEARPAAASSCEPPEIGFSTDEFVPRCELSYYTLHATPPLGLVALRPGRPVDVTASVTTADGTIKFSRTQIECDGSETSMDASAAYTKTTYTLTNVVPGDVLAPFWSTNEPLLEEMLTVVDGTSCPTVELPKVSCTDERPDTCDSYDSCGGGPAVLACCSAGGPSGLLVGLLPLVLVVGRRRNQNRPRKPTPAANAAELSLDGPSAAFTRPSRGARIRLT